MYTYDYDSINFYVETEFCSSELGDFEDLFLFISKSFQSFLHSLAVRRICLQRRHYGTGRTKYST